MTEPGRPGGTFVVDAPLTEERLPEPPLRRAPVARRSALQHLAGGLGTAFGSPRVWLFLVLVQMLLAAPVAMLAWQATSETAARNADTEFPAGTDFHGTAPRWFFEDLARARPGLEPAVGDVLTVLALLSSALGLLFCAGWMHLALHRARHGLAGFLQSGGRFFVPFLGTWLLGLPLLAGLHWIGTGPPAEAIQGWFLPEGQADRAASESTALWVGQAMQAFALLLLLLGETAIDLGRASLVARKSGNVVAGMIRGPAFLLRHPLKVAVVVLGGFVLEFGWLEGMGILAQQGGAWMLLIVPVSIAGRVVLRGARWCALATLSFEAIDDPDEASLEVASPWSS